MLYFNFFKDGAVCVLHEEIIANKLVVCIHISVDDVARVPIDGSSRLGFFQLRVTVLPVMDSITGAPSGGSGRTSAKETDLHKARRVVYSSD